MLFPGRKISILVLVDPKQNLVILKSDKQKKKKKKKKEKKVLSSFFNFSTFHFQFSTIPFTIFLLSFSIFTPFPFFPCLFLQQKFPGQKSLRALCPPAPHLLRHSYSDFVHVYLYYYIIWY